MREMREAIAKALMIGPAPHVEIRVDTFGTLLSALERAGVPVLSNPIPGPTSTFMGIPVIANPIMPAGFAAIIVDGEVTNIFDLRAAEESAG